MTRIRLFPLAVLALIIVFCAFGQLAWAQPTHHFNVRGVPHAQAAKPSAAAVNLFPLTQAFVATAEPTYYNSDGSDIWPCFAYSGGNSDCPTIGDPQIQFPVGGVVLGGPAYLWPLSACDSNLTGDVGTFCGQTETFYEDNTGDNTDDLLYIITATQVQNGKTVYLYDSGTVDFLTNPFSPGDDIIVYGDSNFGSAGVTGKNNGNCYANYNYPSPDFSLGLFVIQANKTCVEPIAGPVTITATTELATPTWTQKNGQDYTVKFKVQYKISQKWTIYLQ